MKKFKFLKFITILPIVVIPTIATIPNNTNIVNNNQLEVNLHSGQIDPSWTEEQIKAAQDQFWIEFGITAGSLTVIIIICLIIYFVTKRRK